MNSSVGFGERVRRTRERKNITLKQIEDATGISNGTLSRIERQLNSPSIDIAVSIADYLEESLDYLARGICKYEDDESSLDPDLQNLIEAYNLLDANSRQLLKVDAAFLLSRKHQDVLEEALSKSRKPNISHKPESTKEEQSVYLPLLGTAAAGMPILSEELLEGFVPVPTDRIKKNNYLIKVKGDSMIEAGIMDGDIVIINPQPVVESGEIALVSLDSEVTIKKFYQQGAEVRLKPANRTMKEIIVRDLDKFKILGKVIDWIPGDIANAKMRVHFNGAD